MNFKMLTGRFIICMNIAFVAVLLSNAVSARAQEEVASTLRHYKDQEVITGYYEQYEVMARRQRPRISAPPGLQRTFPYSKTAARVRIRTRLADSHLGIKFYDVLRCEYCHVEQTKDIHSVRAIITCRQCHGGEPIASIGHAYSLLNPIRRHAYVCAKCHEGANPSFATYVVHQPEAGSLTAKREFPILYYSYWFMLVLLVGTLAFFIPHTFLVGAREVFERLKRLKGKDERDDEQAADQQTEPGDASDEKTDEDKKQNDADIRDHLEDEQRDEKGREQILEMLTKLKDQFSLSIYKKVYHISDIEIAEKRRMLNRHSEKHQ